MSDENLRTNGTPAQHAGEIEAHKTQTHEEYMHWVDGGFDGALLPLIFGHKFLHEIGWTDRAWPREEVEERVIHGANVGLRLDNHVALDIEDTPIGEIIFNRLKELFPSAPIRKRPGSKSRALLFAMDGPVAAVKIKEPGKSGKTYFELLAGRKKQLHILGHRSDSNNVRLEWSSFCPHAFLPTLDTEAASDIISEVTTILQESGLQYSIASPGMTDHYDDDAPGDAKEFVDEATMSGALDSIENGDWCSDYDTWQGLAYAVARLCGGNAEIQNQFLTWSTPSKKIGATSETHSIFRQARAGQVRVPPRTAALLVANALMDHAALFDDRPRAIAHDIIAATPIPQELLDLLTPIAVEFYEPKDRSNLLADEWLKLDLPSREFLMGQVLSTTSRWLISGETGVGKTLIGLDLAAAVACGSSFIHWDGSGERKRVLYLDGELPAETFKERIANITRTYGSGIELYGYCRDVLDEDDMPPINSPQGKKWLMREILTLKPDLVVFDSIMCLTQGNLKEEESWLELKPLVRWISRQRTAQIWLHHTGRNTEHSYGTTVREWEMDSTIMLTKVSDSATLIEDSKGSVAPFQWEFGKARLRTPENYTQFRKSRVWRDMEGFKSELEGHAANASSGRAKGRARKDSDKDIEARRLQDMFLAIYRELAAKADNATHDPHIKIPVEAIKMELIRKGEIEATRYGGLPSTERSRFNRAKTRLKEAGAIEELDGRVWELLSYQV